MEKKNPYQTGKNDKPETPFEEPLKSDSSSSRRDFFKKVGRSGITIAGITFFGGVLPKKLLAHRGYCDPENVCAENNTCPATFASSGHTCTESNYCYPANVCVESNYCTETNNCGVAPSSKGPSGNYCGPSNYCDTNFCEGEQNICYGENVCDSENHCASDNWMRRP
ncbi:hypothetical protein ACFL02_05310 [Planctomycetota bacterium]